jgi:uncharacterized protein YecE (DUF72 family)
MATGRDLDIAWLTDAYRPLGDRLGAIHLAVPAPILRDDERLAGLLDVWPADLPLALDLQHPSWHVDEVFARLREAGVTLAATEGADDDDPPTIRRLGSFLYVRLRRNDYGPKAVTDWADRLVPFVADGCDAYAFFRHDETGRAAELAMRLADAGRDRLARG